MSFRELFSYVGSDIFDARVIALGAPDDRFGNGDDVPVAQRDRFVFRRVENAIRNDLRDIVSASDDRGADASRYGAYRSFHVVVAVPFYFEKIYCIYTNSFFIGCQVGGA